MSYIEKIGNSISNKSKDIVQKAKDASEVSSLNSIIKNETQKIELNYKMMGKLYFEKYGSAPADDFASAVNAIRASMEKISQTQEMIKKIKVRRCCPTCMTPFKSGSAFCAKCGTKLVQEPCVVMCYSCGAQLMPGAQFCKNCGTRQMMADNFNQPYMQPVNAVPVNPVPVNAVPVAPEISEQPVTMKKVCPSCGAVSEDDLAAFCNDCGAKI